MKRSIIIIMIFIFTYLNGAYGFVNSRYVWWKKRYQTLNHERNGMLTENNYDGMLIGLLNNEIERSEEILEIFESKLNDKGSLNYSRQKYSIAEIQKNIHDISAPIFYSCYLEFLVNNTGSEHSIERGRALVKSRLADLVKEYFNDNNEEFPDTVIKDKINSSDWKYIGMEALISSMEKKKDKLLTDSIAEIEKRTLSGLSDKELFFTPKELNDAIQFKAEEYIASLNLSEILEFNSETLNESWCWREISTEIKREFQFLKDIIILINPAESEKSIMNIYSYCKNPLKLDEAAFIKPAAECFDDRRLKNTNAYDKDSYVMAIPDSPDMKELLAQIDSSRKERVKKINGLEEEKYFDEARENFTTIIDKYFETSKDAFLNREENLKLKNASEKSSAANESEFREAENIFNNKFARVNIYRDKSVEFLKWLSNTKKSADDLPVDKYNYRLSRNRDYIAFMQGIIEACGGLASVESTDLRNKFSMSVQRTSNVYKSIDFSFSIDKDERTKLNNKNLNSINNIRTEMQDDIRNSKLEINNFYCNLVRNFRNANRPATDEEKSLQKRIAELEIELINNKINDFVSGFEKLNYTDEILKKYSSKFSELENNIKENKKSPELQSALKENSIFPLIENYDKQKFLKEYNTRRYISIDLTRDMARMKTLMEFYKRSGVIIEKPPLKEEIKDIKLKMNLKPSVRIAGWIMNESNFEDIDKNAVRRLAFIQKRNIWKDDASLDEDSALLPVLFEKLNISMTIPDGWIEQQLVNSEIRNGIMKYYKSIDGKSSIYIAGVDAKGMNYKEISEFWMSRMGRMKIKERWGKKDNIEYLWTLSKSSKNDVMELYAISFNNHILLLSGITAKDKYNYFKGKIDSVFNSITPLF